MTSKEYDFNSDLNHDFSDSPINLIRESQESYDKNSKININHHAPWHTKNKPLDASKITKNTTANITPAVEIGINSDNQAASINIKDDVAKETTSKFENTILEVAKPKISANSSEEPRVENKYNLKSESIKFGKFFGFVLLIGLTFSTVNNKFFTNQNEIIQGASLSGERINSVDQEFNRLKTYMESRLDPNGFKVSDNLSSEISDGVLIITTNSANCWYFGAVGAKIFEPRFDETGQKCIKK